MATPPTDPARRVLELFPLLLDAATAERERLLTGEPPEVRDRLRRMLDVETMGFTQAAQGAVRDAARPPESVGDFRLLAPIGEGGMGLVFLAEQGSPRRRVAVKLMRPTLTGERARQVFRAEVESLARFSGPGFPFLIAAGFDGAWPWLAMAWVQGEPIDRWAAGVGFDERLQALVALCRIVDRAHARGVAHLDLKPGNVLVGPDGVTVLDMGIAQVAGALGLGAGTPGWRAPEQVAGEAVTVRSDVYALGRLALAVVGPGTALDDVIARATAGDPDARPPRAGALATELLEALGPRADTRTDASTFARRVAVAVHDAAPTVSDGVTRVIERAMLGREGLRPAVAALAEALDRGVVRERPDVELRLRLLLVEACATLALDDLALRQAEAALGLAPLVGDGVASAQAHLAAARAWRLQGRPDAVHDALALAEAALPVDHPLRADLWFLRGTLALDGGDPAAAVPHLRRALDVPAPPRAAVELLIHALSLSGDLPEAQRQALALLDRERARFDGAPHVGLAAAHGVCAVAFGEGGDPARALEHARAEVDVRLATIGPDARPTQQAFQRLALAHLGLGQTADAVRAIERGLGDPPVPSTLLTLAGVLEADGQLDRARQVAEDGLGAALDDNPDSPMIPMFRGTLGTILTALGRPTEALAHLDAALPVLQSWQVGGKTGAQIQTLADLRARLRAEVDGAGATS